MIYRIEFGLDHSTRSTDRVSDIMTSDTYLPGDLSLNLSIIQLQALIPLLSLPVVPAHLAHAYRSRFN